MHGRDSEAAGDSARSDREVGKASLLARELARSDAIRRAVTLSATELLRSLDLSHSIPKVLRLIGEATDVSRVEVCERQAAADGRVALSQRFEWHAPGCSPSAETQGLPLAAAMAAGPPIAAVAAGEPRAVIARNAEEPIRRLLEAQGIRSALLVPILVDEQPWGTLSIADCRAERAWSPIELDTSQTVAELIAAATARARGLKELSDASRVIENSPAVLYRIGPQSPFPLTYVSRNISRYGYSPADLLADPTRYFEFFHHADLPQAMLDLARIADGRINEITREWRLRAADGSYVWFEDRTRALYDEQQRLAAIEGLLIDINDRKRAEAQIAHFSQTDPVTGLANRKAFMDELARAFTAARRGGKGFAIHYLDLDHFKDINDVLGHSIGDALLKLVAQRLIGLHRESDVVARFGGDEFAILQAPVSDPSDAGALAARILHDLAEPYDLGTQIHVTASIGIAVYARDVDGPEEMIKRADMALYRAKDLGRNQYHFHSEELDVAIIERVTLAGDLRRALDRGELELYYQPQVELSTGRIVGLEALARWHHPKHGLLCPTRFIPIAEKTGTILPLGRWVLEEVCRQITRWRAQELQPPAVSVNVSAAQLKGLPSFDQELAQILRQSDLEPAALELELTESVLMETTQAHGEIIDRLHAMGIPIAIDDFGTGYSSLGYLRAYRVNHIKIAQEFIRNLQPDSGDVAIVRAAISLARELGIKVIAEGVETAFQRDLLAEAGCQYVQGFYFSQPLPASEAGELLRRSVLQPAAPLTAIRRVQ
jgi:diguanylate cyclase (GGDEF)-like protein/PAS domain S-box-containing protein